MTRSPLYLLIALVLLGAGCRPDLDTRPATPEATVRDSAGVTIVENGPRESMTPLNWQLPTASLVEIGGLEAPETHQLFRVRDAHRLPDGRIVVANGGTQEVRIFGAEGTHLTSFGGEGSGPGEFTGLSQVEPWPGDSLAAWDGRTRRLSFFDQAGALGRTLTLDAREGLRSFGNLHMDDRGRVILTGTQLDMPDGGSVTLRPPVTAVRIDDTGTTMASFGTHPGSEAYIRFGDSSIEIVRLPVLRTSHSALWDGRFVIAASEEYELPVFGMEGELERIVRLASEPRPLTGADIAREIDYAVSQAPEERRAARRESYEGVPFPEFFQELDRLHQDVLDNLWVRDARPPSATGPRRWTVFDREGQALGRMETPENLTIYQIGADWILGRTTDDLDVERVALLKLSRGGGS